MKALSAKVVFVLPPVAAAVAATLIPLSAHAAAKSWNCTGGNWDNSNCWQPAGTPTAADQVLVGNSANVAIGNATTAWSSTLQVSGNVLTSARVTQTGGGNSTDVLTLGQGSVRYGSYTLSAGQLFAGIETLGSSGGIGYFSQSGGTHLIGRSITLGDTANAFGAYSMTGGSLNGGRQLIVGNQGLGLFNQNGGSVSVDALLLGQASNSAGYYRISNTGQLRASDLRVGVAGSASFNQSGNSSVALQTLTVGQAGSYTLAGGTLSLPIRGGTAINQGQFTQTGGMLMGGLANGGNFEFSGGTFTGKLTNTGTASLRNFSTQQGIINSGQIKFASGTSSVGALLGNQAGGAITTAAGANVNVTGTTQHDGSWQIGSGAQVSFQQYAGAGSLTGDGAARFLSSVSTGSNTATVKIDVASTFESTSNINLKIGDCLTCHDKLSFSKAVTLGGDLTLQSTGAWQGANGDIYDLFDWNGTHTGSFNQVLLPTLASGLAWDTSALYTSGEISIHAAALAQASAFRAMPLSVEWSGSSLAAVPEPETYALLLAGLMVIGSVRRKQAR